MINELPVTLSYAGMMYDRTVALATREVRTEGFEIDYTVMPVADCAVAIVREREFDAAEIPLAVHVARAGNESYDLAGLPCFVGRAFPLGHLWVRAGSELGRLEDLEGRSVGVVADGLTSALWLRAILRHRGVDLESIRWSVEAHESVALLPGTGCFEAQAGEVDVWLRSAPPEGLEVRRLLADARALERDFAAATGVFPMTSLVAVRGGVLRDAPWLASAVSRAFTEAKDLALDRLRTDAAAASALPWSEASVEEARSLFGDDWWPYGEIANHDALAMFTSEAEAAGLVEPGPDRRVLFAADALAE